MNDSVTAELKCPPDTRENRKDSTMATAPTAAATYTTPLGPSSPRWFPAGLRCRAVSSGYTPLWEKIDPPADNTAILLAKTNTAVPARRRSPAAVAAWQPSGVRPVHRTHAPYPPQTRQHGGPRTEKFCAALPIDLAHGLEPELVRLPRCWCDTQLALQRTCPLRGRCPLISCRHTFLLHRNGAWW
jgi:hypothetical protein